jgi:cytochrome c-type biogenesis protein CcmE
MKPRTRRAVALAVGLLTVGAASALVLNAFRSNMVFFYSPTQVAAREAIARFASAGWWKKAA